MIHRAAQRTYIYYNYLLNVFIFTIYTTDSKTPCLYKEYIQECLVLEQQWSQRRKEREIKGNLRAGEELLGQKQD